MENKQSLFSRKLTFDDFKQENGNPHWWASDLMKMLGYANMKSFKKVINRAIKTLMTLNIDQYDNIAAESREINDKEIQDFKLTRFACYIIVMNGDTKKEEVAKAQVYFAEQTRKFELSLEKGEKNINRLLIREELKEGNKSLHSTIKEAGVDDYAKFTNAGYLGMYNMHSWQLANKRRVKSTKLMDYMGRTELAANLFRVTQAEERIKNRNIKGQYNLEQTHRNVGKEVRDIVIKNVGKSPENLEQEKQLPDVKKRIKRSTEKNAI